jgi:hypothetical protein
MVLQRRAPEKPQPRNNTGRQNAPFGYKRMPFRPHQNAAENGGYFACPDSADNTDRDRRVFVRAPRSGPPRTSPAVGPGSRTQREMPGACGHRRLSSTYGNFPKLGKFPAFRGSSPPRTHHDERLTCGYAMGWYSPESGQDCFRRSGPWGFKSGPGCGTVTAIVGQTDLRILRDAPSGKPWPAEDTGRLRRGRVLVSGTHRAPADCGHPVDTANQSLR